MHEMEQSILTKTNILFDASILISKPYFGISFVTKNMLREFNRNSKYTITLYFQEHHKNIKKILRDELLCRFPFFIDGRNKFEYNIERHKETIRYSKKVFKNIWYSLKIIKNYTLLFFRTIKNNDAILNTINVYFSPVFAIPFHIKKISRIHHFVMLYDTIPSVFPYFYTELNLKNSWYTRLTESLDKGTYYFCISEHVKKDFLKYFGSKLDESSMFVTHIASSHPLYPLCNQTKLNNILKNHHILYSDKYILSLCSLEPRKNLVFTIKAFVRFIQKHNIQDLCFYICGTTLNTTYIRNFEEAMDGLGIYKEKIVRLGYVDDEDVNTLYSNALFFTYISRYEGFGLPPLEAMQAGTPVITSDNSSLPEVVGDAAITIDCDSEEQCIKAFEDLYFNEALRKEYIAKGLERAKLFSWEKTVNKMSGIIDEVVRTTQQI
jgi:glycosyltransferase involved in cell wall biosynthesis